MGPIERFLTADHERLGQLLDRSIADDGAVDEATFSAFRHDLLRHIGMEEKVLLPFAKAANGGAPLPMAARLRQDHGAIARLLVRAPTPAGIAELRAILAAHDPLEEGPEGLYARCDALAGDGATAIVERLRAQPTVPVAPYYDGPIPTR